MPLKSRSAEATKAKSGIFISVETAKKIVGDLQYCNEKLPAIDKELETCDLQVINLNEQTKTLNLTLTGMQQDNAALLKVKDEYKDKYVKTNEALVKEQASKPSRLVWYGTGFISALIIGIAMALVIK